MPAVRANDLRTAVVAEALHAAMADLGPGPLRIVDAGGGTGSAAVPLAVEGHTVVVVDPSLDSLAALERRAAEVGVADRVRALQGDLGDLGRLVEPGAADVVLCHGVLDVVEDRQGALAAVVAALRVGGLASILVANRLALVLQRSVAGRFAEAALLLDPVPAPGPVDAAELAAAVGAAGLDLLALSGVRVVSDLVPGALLDAEPQAADALLRLERVAATHPDLLRVATQLHALGRRPGGVVDPG